MGNIAEFMTEIDKTRMHTVLMALMLWLSPGLLSASVQVKKLYDFEVSVRDQGAAERQRAMQLGLTTVVRRLSGSKGMQQLSDTKSVLKRAPKYVEQYRYRKSTSSKAGLKLWMRFNSRALQTLLSNQQLPVWGSSRPQTLLWLAIENNRGRSILSNKKSSSFYRSVMSHAHRRGLPLSLPKMDREDRGKVRMGDIWGGFSTSVKVASARYKYDNLLMGKIYKTSGGWRSEWTLVRGAAEKRWSGSGTYAGQAIAAGIDGLADLLVSSYSVRGDGTQTSYRIAINQVNSLQDYDRCNRYLSGISLISAFNLLSISQDRLVYQINLRGNVDRLERALKLERGLQEDNSSRPQDAVGSAMTSVRSLGTTLNQAQMPITFYYRLRQ